MIDCTKTTNYFAEKLRMTKRTKNGICKTKCSDCPLCSENNGTSEGLSCVCFEMHYPEKAIEKVQGWSDEHPQKTYLSEFIRNYPGAELGKNGTPIRICPKDLGLSEIEGCGGNENCCIECWNQPIEESEK